MLAIHKPRKDRLAAWLFGPGDFLFLVVVGAGTTLSMHWIHGVGWNLAVALMVGMALAMLIQMALALAVSPILGYRESMLPSMVIAMVSPMAVCVLDLMDFHASWGQLVFLGALLGAGAHLVAWRCGCYSARVHPQERGPET